MPSTDSLLFTALTTFSFGYLSFLFVRSIFQENSGIDNGVDPKQHFSLTRRRESDVDDLKHNGTNQDSDLLRDSDNRHDLRGDEQAVIDFDLLHDGNRNLTSNGDVHLSSGLTSSQNYDYSTDLVSSAPDSSSSRDSPLDDPIFSYKAPLPNLTRSEGELRETEETSEALSSTGRRLRRVHTTSERAPISRSATDLESIGTQFQEPEIPLSDLPDQLYKARIEWPKGRRQYFIPTDTLRQLVTVESIKSTLRESDPDLSDDALQKLATQAHDSAYKLFAILVYLEKGEFFYGFLREGVDDDDLPLMVTPDGQNLYSCQRPDEHLRCIASWGLLLIDQFCLYQWQMLAPIFDEDDQPRHYDLLDNHVLPFIEYHDREKKSGGYGSVWKALMHPAHQNLYRGPNVSNPYLALKKLHYADDKAFLREVEMLKYFSNHKNSHLIKLLATYRWNNDYYFIFPYAKYNLRQYWENNPHPEALPNAGRWMLEQCKGIAAGLYEIHEYRRSLGGGLTPKTAPKDRLFGRHGDIKPDNILWFEQSINQEGKLLIADFGLMEFHGERTKSHVQPDGIVASPTYVPPELRLHREISREYDVWSLGCVYLEFISWLVLGWQELDAFPSARGHTNVSGVNDDTFFTIIDNGQNAEVRAEVLAWIQRVHEAPSASLFVHEFLDLISDRMLVVLSTERIKCGELNSSLLGMLKNAQADPKYLTEPVQWIPKEDTVMMRFLNDIRQPGPQFLSVSVPSSPRTVLRSSITPINPTSSGRRVSFDSNLISYPPISSTPPPRVTLSPPPSESPPEKFLDVDAETHG